MGDDNDDEDILNFASLMGGSLMKDLLADLQVDDTNDGGDASGWLTLDQIEQELDALNNNSNATTTAAAATAVAPGAFSSSSYGAGPPGLPTAASMVVQHQQIQQPPQQQSHQQLQNPAIQPQDAWSLSLQNFSATGSLEQEFLNADSARKQKPQQKSSSVTSSSASNLPPGLDVSLAQNYDISEITKAPPGLSLPPGLPPQTKTEPPQPTAPALPPPGLLSSQPPTKTTPEGKKVRSPPKILPKPVPATPQNSISVLDGDIDDKESTPKRAAAAANKSKDLVAGVAAALTTKAQEPPAVVSEKNLPTKTRVDPKTPRSSIADRQPPPVPVQRQPAPPPPKPAWQGMAASTPPPGGLPRGPPQVSQRLPPQQQHPIHPQQGPPVVPMAVPVATRAPGAAWQQPPQHQQQRPPPPVPAATVYCNPHPQAPPIPAAVLASKYMKTRDIGYVVHAILRPLIQAGSSPSDYDIQLLLRHSGNAAAGTKKSRKAVGDENDPLIDEMQSRATKSKEWSQEKTTLGHVAKTNVARPRALIAIQSSDNNGGSDKAADVLERKQRAAIWKARIVCDQAYQAYDQLNTTMVGGRQEIARTIGKIRMKLMKCMGLTATKRASQQQQVGGGDEYQVEVSVLEMLLKLNKGRTLMSRVLEQALIPLSAVRVLFPALLDTLYSSKSDVAANPSLLVTDSRLFGTLTRIVVEVASAPPPPSGDGPADLYVRSLQTVLSNSSPPSSSSASTDTAKAAALSTVQRMQFAHALLQTGAGVVATSSDDKLKEEWKQTESKFMKVLAEM